MLFGQDYMCIFKLVVLGENVDDVGWPTQQLSLSLGIEQII